MTVIDAALSPPFSPENSDDLDPASQLTPQAWIWSDTQTAQQCWEQWASETADWLKQQGVPVRDALVVVPVGAVLALVRRAWAQAVGGWAPAIETVASLISAQGWRQAPAGASAGHVTLDTVLDQLQVSQRLAKEAWCRQWMARDPRGFDHAVEQVVQAAHSWVRRAQAIPPGQRAVYWQRARTCLGTPAPGVMQYGSREKLLLAWALEWAIESMDSGIPSDVLFALPHRACIGISAGQSVSPGTEAHWMLGMMAAWDARGTPVRWVVAQGPSGTPCAQPELIRCTDAEDEARHTAAVVLSAVNGSRQSNGDPVALIALDRSLVRRVRAMLDGAGATVADETGWRLSTTRATTVVTRLLQAAHPQATTDDLLDWLKSGWVQLNDLAHCDELEAWYRHHNWLRAWDAPSLSRAEPLCSDGAQRLWLQAHDITQAFRALRTGKKRALRVWLQAVVAMLTDAQAWQPLLEDEAGALVADALHLSHPDLQDDTVWQHLLDQTLLDGVGFGRWVHDVLENTTFRPAPPEGRIDVVVTPMARAVMRPFHSIVIPGADARQLGSMGTASNWLGTALSRQMLLATPEDLREAQWEAFCLLLSRQGVVCLHRQGQGSEPMEASPWLARWALAHDAHWQTTEVAWHTQTVDTALTEHPMPRLRADQADQLAMLPSALSATSYEALRQCPYRFFAQSVLKLRDVDELEEGLDRSDYGTWLHEVIRRFHVQREQMLAIRTLDEDIQAWLATAEQVMKDMGLQSDATRPYFLPYLSVLPMMASAYVRWLHEHEQEGWRCVDNESSQQRTVTLPDDCGPLNLKGQIDRIDTCYRDGQRARMVIDYKSGSLQGLRDKVKRPMEDTQLPFYAVLMGANDGPAGEVTDAAYLHLDAKAATLVRHADVAEHAEQLLEGLMVDLARIRQGAPMPALGDAAACTYCAARGLCRKDHWPLTHHNKEGQS